MSLPKHHFCIAGNSRLAFKGAAARVEAFLATRLRHHSISHDFCSDWTALEARVHALASAPPADIEHIVIVDVMNPFTDLDLVMRMTEVVSRTQLPFVRCDGAVPGTEVRAVLPVARLASLQPFALGRLEGGVPWCAGKPKANTTTS